MGLARDKLIQSTRAIAPFSSRRSYHVLRRWRHGPDLVNENLVGIQVWSLVLRTMMQWKAELTGSSEQRFQVCQPVEVAQLNGSRVRGAIYPVMMDSIRIETVAKAVFVHNLFLLIAP